MSKVRIVSRETIKSSSPTPENLRYLQLSLLDQLASSVHVPLIYFFSGDEISGKASRLKESLSQTLTSFYPLAGRIKHKVDSGDFHVDCNDQGVDFYEARVDGELAKTLRQPSTDHLKPLLPYPVPEDVPLVIQFNVFECGGSALAFYITHRFNDMASIDMFVKTWAQLTRPEANASEAVSPKFDSTSLFPPRTMKQLPPDELAVKGTNAVVTQRLLFEVSKVASLREQVKVNTGFFPTRMEVVTALIWRCAMRARREGTPEKTVVVGAVNMRKRKGVDPLVPEYSFGNLWLPFFATSEGDTESYCVGYLERRLSESVGDVKGDYLRQVLENDMFTCGPIWNVFPKKWEEHGFELYSISSLYGFSVYETDFGWGKPEWFTVVNPLARNVVFLLPARNHIHIEALVCLGVDEMARFQQDPELLAFVSDTSIKLHSKI